MSAVATGVPASAPPSHDEIAHEAFLLWSERGYPHGRDVEHWLEAEMRLRRHQAAYEVVLVDPGDRTIELIRELRAVTGLDLVQVKALVDAATPQPIKRTATKEEAEELMRDLRQTGGVLEIRPTD